MKAGWIFLLLGLAACGSGRPFAHLTVHGNCFASAALAVDVALTAPGATDARMTTVCFPSMSTLISEGGSFVLEFAPGTRGQLRVKARAVEACAQAAPAAAEAETTLDLRGDEVVNGELFFCGAPQDKDMPPGDASFDLQKSVCCGLLGGPSALVLTTTTATGNCGSATRNPPPARTLECGKLYTGGGDNDLTLPMRIPENTKAVAKVTQCNSETMTLGKTTALEEGLNGGCTQAGCPLGPPLPAANVNPLDTACIVMTISKDLTGTANCQSGSVDLTLSVDAEVFNAGDAAADPGVQPCPICVSGSCHGGSTPGAQCVTNNVDLTSRDCLPQSGQSRATIPLAWNLTSGATTWTATPGTGGSLQQTVFCGYCRDRNGSGMFKSPAASCLVSGTPGAMCSEPHEACEQTSSGAFGPAQTNVQSISLMGKPLAIGASGYGVTLQSLFCIPPTGTMFADGTGDLPGPGAVSMSGLVEIKP